MSKTRQARHEELYPTVVKGISTIAGAVLTGLALLVSFGLDLTQTVHGGAADFRNRITGARLLAHGINPYRFIWHEGEPSEFCDLRNNPHLTISKTTVTPAVLAVYLPLAALPYRVAQFIWLVMQWLLLLGVGWLWWRANPTARLGWFIALFITGFSYTQGWRWEAERGQVYTLLIFLSAYVLTRIREAQPDGDFVRGCLAGFLAALWPPFFLLVLFIALHRRGRLWGMAVGLLVGLGLPMLIHLECWADYFSAMQTNSDNYRHAFNPARGPQAFPAVIEGTPTSILAHMALFPNGDISIYALLRHLGIAPVPAMPLLAALAGCFASWLVWSRKQPIDALLPGLAAWIFLTDLFLPTTRWGYYDLLILNVFLARIVTAKKFPWTMCPILLALPCGWAVALFSVPQAWLYAPAVLFTLGAVLALFPETTGRNSKCAPFA